MKWHFTWMMVALTFALTGCGKSADQENFAALMDNNGRPVLTHLLGVELDLPANVSVFPEGERGATITFGMVSIKEGAALILPQLENAGFTVTKTSLPENASSTHPSPTAPLSYVATKDEQRFNFVFQAEADSQ